MFDIAAKLKRHKNAADLRTLLAEVEAALAEAERRHTELASRKEEVFLTGGEAEIRALQDQLSEAARTLDMLNVQSRALRRRADDAELAEQRQAVARQLKDAEAAAVEGAKLIDMYRRQAEAMATMLQRLVEVDREIERANAARAEAIEAGWLDGDECRPVTAPQVRIADPAYGLNVEPIYRRVRLPHPQWIGQLHWDGKPCIWPPAKD